MNPKKIVSILTSVATVGAMLGAALVPLAAGAVTGNLLHTFGSTGLGNNQFSLPDGAAVDSFGNLYVADFNNSRIEVFAPFTPPSTIPWIANFYSLSAGDPLAIYPADVALDPTYPSSGFLYAAVNDGNANTTSAVKKLNSSGGFVTDWSVSNRVQSIAVDPTTGHVWLTIVGPTSVPSLEEYTSTGVPGATLTYPSGCLLGQWLAATAITFDSAGNKYVSDHQCNTVIKINSAGAQVAKYGSPGTGNGQFAGMGDVAVDSSGNMYVVDAGGSPASNYRIQVLDSTGAFVTSFSQNGLNTSQGSFAILSLAVSNTPTRYLYATEFANDVRIYEGAPTPTPTPTPGAAHDFLTFFQQRIIKGQQPRILPYADTLLRVYNLDDPAFIAAYGTGTHTSQLDTIYFSSVGLVSSCTTNLDGACTANEPAPGNYLVIGTFTTDESGNDCNPGGYFVGKTKAPEDFVGGDAFLDLKVINQNGRCAPVGQIKVTAADASRSYAKGSSGNTIALAFLALAAGFGIGIYLKQRGHKA